MIDSIFKVLLFIHIIAGTVSLVLFWVPVFTRKGGNIHVKIGKIYVWFMWVVVISAGILCLLNVFRGNLISAAFLGFLTVLSGQPLWYGISILKHKKQVPPKMLLIKRMLSAVLLFGGAGLLLWGILLKGEGQAILLIIFGVLGLTTIQDVFGNKATSESNWYLEHIGGMIGTGIAAYTAFLAFGGATVMGHIFTGPWLVVPWVTPAIVGTIAISFLSRRFRAANQ